MMTGAPIAIELQVNGAGRSASIDPRATVLEVLRDSFGLTGTKQGCDRGECGACTVLIDGRPVPSCLVLAASAAGTSITTIEGLATDGTLDPVQQAFVDHDALQCGFCTPGQILTAVACLAAGRAGSDDEVREWMSGNLCRCAAYPQIVAAVRSLAPAG
jgi:xanthine dehydrogenase YagT iron-sulfur-binding subunit